MPDQRLLLTDKSVEKLPLATEGQYFVRDTELRGFLILVADSDEVAQCFRDIVAH